MQSPQRDILDNLWFFEKQDFFDGLEKEKRIFFQKARFTVLPKSTIIFFEGDPGDACFFVASGLVRIFSNSDSGKEPCFFIRRPGEMFGLSEVLNNFPRSVNAQTLMSTKLYSITGENFEEMLAQSYPLTRRVISILGCRLRQLSSNINGLMTSRVMTRLIKLLIALVYDRLSDEISWRSPAILPLTLSQEQLASMTGSTQQTISSILQYLQKNRLIEVTKRRICIVNPFLLLLKAGECPPSNNTEVKNWTM